MAGASCHGIEQRLNLRTKTPILWRTQQIDACHERAHFCLCLLDGNTRTQTANGISGAIFPVSLLLLCHGPRYPDVRAFSGIQNISGAREAESCRHNTDNSIRLRVEKECLSQNVSFRPEAS